MRFSIRISTRILALACVCLATACGGPSGSSGPADGGTVIRSSVARDTNPQVSGTEFAALVAGNTEFALKLFPLLDASPDNNTFFSPYSITQAFALLAPGARGTTLDEIGQVLSFPLTPLLRNASFNKLDLLLAASTTGAVLDNGLQTPQLSNANTVWGQQGFTILPDYLDTLAVNFGAGLHTVDFVNATEASRQTINDWVEGKTHNRIRNLIPEGGVSTMTRLVLTNAIWFKANWASPFLVQNTTTMPFITRGNAAVPTPFMQKMFSVPYVRAAGCQAVDIPYAGDGLSMLVIMPDPGTFDAFAAALTPAVLADITASLATRKVQLALPKFTFTREVALKGMLQSLGMNDAFEPLRADFSGIDGNRDLFVGAVFHQAFIAVDEAGTEAAAATAITIGTTSVPVTDVTLTVDHPFIFLIRDRTTGSILFMGKVVSL